MNCCRMLRTFKALSPNVFTLCPVGTSSVSRRRYQFLFSSCHQKDSDRSLPSPELKTMATRRRPESEISKSVPSSFRFWVPFLSLSGFAAIAILVFGDADNGLLKLDVSVHDWVDATIPSNVRFTLFEQAISNLFSNFNVLIGSIVLYTHWTSNPKRGFFLIGLSAIFLFLGVVSYTHDGLIVHALKESFHRMRPTPGFASFAFPSGHVTTAVFLTGALLFVWLPVTYKALSSDTNPLLKGFIEETNITTNQKLWIWLTAFLCTAVGRVGADVHWTSDTIAGCLLGISLTSLFESTVEWIDKEP